MAAGWAAVAAGWAAVAAGWAAVAAGVAISSAGLSSYSLLSGTTFFNWAESLRVGITWAAADGRTGAFLASGFSAAIFGTPSLNSSVGSSGGSTCFGGCTGTLGLVSLSTTISSANLNFGGSSGKVGSGVRFWSDTADFWSAAAGTLSCTPNPDRSGSLAGLGVGVATCAGSLGARGVVVCCASGLGSAAAGTSGTGTIGPAFFSIAGVGFAGIDSGFFAGGSGFFAAGSGVFSAAAGFDVGAVGLSAGAALAVRGAGASPGVIPNTSTATLNTIFPVTWLILFSAAIVNAVSQRPLMTRGMPPAHRRIIKEAPASNIVSKSPPAAVMRWRRYTSTSSALNRSSVCCKRIRCRTRSSSGLAINRSSFCGPIKMMFAPALAPPSEAVSASSSSSKSAPRRSASSITMKTREPEATRSFRIRLKVFRHSNRRVGSRTTPNCARSSSTSSSEPTWVRPRFATSRSGPICSRARCTIVVFPTPTGPVITAIESFAVSAVLRPAMIFACSGPSNTASPSAID